MLSLECFEADRRVEESQHNGNGVVNGLDKVDSIHPNIANSRCMESEGALDIQSQSEWARRASHFSQTFKRITQLVWQEKSVCDMNGRGKQLKMFFIVFMTAIIIIMQVVSSVPLQVCFLFWKLSKERRRLMFANTSMNYRVSLPTYYYLS